MDQYTGLMVNSTVNLVQVQQARMSTAGWSVSGSEINLKWPLKPFLCRICIDIPAVPVRWIPEVSPRASYARGEERNKLYARTNVYLTWLRSGKSKQLFPVSATVFGLITREFYFLYMC